MKANVVKRIKNNILDLNSLRLTLVLCLVQAGKFDTVPTLINLVAAFTSIGLVGISGFKM